MSTLGDFKLHPSATGLKPKRAFRRKDEALELVYQIIYENPRITKEGLSIKTDMGASRLSQLLPALEKAGRIYKVANMPARYRAHEPVKTTRQLVSDIANSAAQEDRKRRTQSEPDYGPEFIVQLNGYFMEFANSNAGGDLNEINKFRLFVINNQGEK